MTRKPPGPNIKTAKRSYLTIFFFRIKSWFWLSATLTDWHTDAKRQTDANRRKLTRASCKANARKHTRLYNVRSDKNSGKSDFIKRNERSSLVTRKCQRYLFLTNRKRHFKTGWLIGTINWNFEVNQCPNWASNRDRFVLFWMTSAFKKSFNGPGCCATDNFLD